LLGNYLFFVYLLNNLQKLYTLGQSGRINNPKTFVFGVLTGDGTLYILMIDNKLYWDTWSSRSFGDCTELSLEALNRFLGITYGLSDKSTDITANEKAFLKFLEESNNGLKLYKGDSENFNNWNGQTLNSNGEVEKVDCK